MKGKILFICRDNSLCLDIMKNNPGVKAVTTCEFFHLKFDGNELKIIYIKESLYLKSIFSFKILDTYGVSN